MTNEEIIEQIDKGESWEYMNTAMVTHIGNLPAALELARQDEREKMKGVDLSKMSGMLRSNSKETWIAAKGSDEGWNTWWKKRNQLNTN